MRILTWSYAMLAIAAWVSLFLYLSAIGGYSDSVPEAFKYRWVVNNLEFLALVPLALIVSSLLGASHASKASASLLLHCVALLVVTATLLLYIAAIHAYIQNGFPADAFTGESAIVATKDPFFALLTTGYFGRAFAVIGLLPILLAFRSIFRAQWLQSN